MFRVNFKKKIHRRGCPNFFDPRTVCEEHIPQTNKESKQIKKRLTKWGYTWVNSTGEVGQQVRATGSMNLSN